MQGGHHLIDVLAALPVTWMALKLANIRLVPATMRDTVNKLPILTVISSQSALSLFQNSTDPLTGRARN